MKSDIEETLKSENSGKFFQRASDFFWLNKPLVVALLLFTTFTAMVVGHKALPDSGITFWTMLGGALSAGGAGAINQFIDRDLDRLMKRTEHRPLPAGRLRSNEGLIYGMISCLSGLLILAGFVNLLSAALSLIGMIYYLLIYTAWLKRLSIYNIVIGGGAGAVPILVGWAAATGRLEINALLLFAVVFLWTPAHFWSLALQHRDEYARAGIPILPVIRGEKSTHKQIIFYVLSLVTLTLLMPLFNIGGRLYFAGALVLGGLFILAGLRLLKVGGSQRARQIYLYSNLYLGLLFLTLILDVLFNY
jgi:heme o synthase